MYVELAGPVDPRSDVRIERVTEPDHAAYMDVFLAGFAMPDFVREPMSDVFTTALDSELFVHLLAWEGDRAVGCGTVFLDAGTAGIYNIAVLESARGRGHRLRRHGGADERRRRRRLHERGAARQRDGRPVYERLGFEEVCETPQWIWMPSGDLTPEQRRRLGHLHHPPTPPTGSRSPSTDITEACHVPHHHRVVPPGTSRAPAASSAVPCRAGGHRAEPDPGRPAQRRQPVPHPPAHRGPRRLQ